MQNDLYAISLLHGDHANQKRHQPESDIVVDNPEKHGEGVKDAYVTFDVRHNKRVVVKRRYQDFHWLHERLCQECPTVILPPLPDRHSLLDMLIDRFSPDFIIKRQHALQRYLRRLAEHSVVKESRTFTDFLNKDYLGQEQHDDSSLGTPTSTTCVPLDDQQQQQDANLVDLAKWQSTAQLLGKHCDLIAVAQHRLIKAIAQCATAWQESAAAHDRLAGVIDLQLRSCLERQAAASAGEARRLDRLVPFF